MANKKNPFAGKVKQGKRINTYNQRAAKAQYLRKYEYISLYICLL